MVAVYLLWGNGVQFVGSIYFNMSHPWLGNGDSEMGVAVFSHFDDSRTGYKECLLSARAKK